MTCMIGAAYCPQLWLSLALALLVAFPGLAPRKDFRAAEQNPQPQGKTAAAINGSITGTVKDPSGAAVSGVRVTLMADGTASRQTAVTDSQGNFMFAAVGPGTYTIEVESAGFQKSTRSRLIVDGQQHLVADFSLLPEGHGSKAPAESATPAASGKTGPSLGGFNYYDQPQFKPGTASVSVDPGGYSAAQEVDAYSLMLDFVEAEGAAPLSGNRRADTQGADRQAPAGSELQPTESELKGWSESQFLSRGSGLLLHHDLQASIDTFEAGVTRFPDSAKLQTGLGIALSARGEHEKAIASLLRATDLAPSDPRPYFVLAKAYAGSSAPSREVPQRLERLVTLHPQNPQARYYYALVLAKGSPGDEATLKQMESLLKGALALDPNFADAHLQLGTVYAALSNYPDAIREYQSAVRLKPNLAAAHYRLAQVYERTGEKAAAQGEFDLYEPLRKQIPENPR